MRLGNLNQTCTATRTSQNSKQPVTFQDPLIKDADSPYREAYKDATGLIHANSATQCQDMCRVADSCPAERLSIGRPACPALTSQAERLEATARTGKVIDWLLRQCKTVYMCGAYKADHAPLRRYLMNLAAVENCKLFQLALLHQCVLG